MKIIREISENEMVVEFLLAEINSDRFGHKIIEVLAKNNLDKSIILNPNLNNAENNDLRRRILDEYRGYENKSELFEGFPCDVKWVLAVITKDELKKVEYINWDYWLEISDNTRLPMRVAENILNGKLVEDKEVKRFKDISNIIKSGIKLPKLILISKNENSKLVVLEGHARITAMALAVDCLPNEIEVIVGMSEKMTLYGNY